MLYLEDFKPGTVWRSVGRTVTEADIVNFAGMSGDFYALHMDEVWARDKGPYGRRIAHGLLVTTITTGLRFPDMPATATLAYLEALRKFVAPVFPGDTIHAELAIEDVRTSKSKPDRGIVRFGFRALNQDGTVVQSGHDALLIGRRPADAAPAAD
jgi:3-hydroxybutyryl-CoA dehydratase